MADLCSYMIKVKGNLKRCFAVVGARNGEEILYTNENNGELIFRGERKYFLDSYCDKKEEISLDINLIPENENDAIKWGNEKLCYRSIEEISRLLNVEIGYVSANAMPRSLSYMTAHYKNGELQESESFVDDILVYWMKEYGDDQYFCSIWSCVKI